MIVECLEGRDSRHMDDTAKRIKSLRTRLTMSHDDVALGSGGRIDRTMMSKLESGRNKASTARVREGLALATGVRPDRMSDYLDGKLSLEEVLAKRSAPDVTQPARATPPRVASSAPDEDSSPLDRALNAAFRGDRHELRDARAVERALAGFHHWQDVDGDLVEAAGRWLDGAVTLRKLGRPVTPGELFVLVSVGKGQVAADAHAKHKAEVDEMVEQRVASFEAQDHGDVEPPDPAAVARLRARAKKSSGAR